MADEFVPYPDVSEFIAQRLAQRIAAKQGGSTDTTNPPPGTVDPYQMMLQKKRGETAPPPDIDPSTVQKWPEESTKALQDYCTKMGIVGFNSGRTHPIAALSMLKQQYGKDYTGIPLEERVPEGYEKRGTPGYGPNYPYTEAMRKKQILHG